MAKKFVPSANKYVPPISNQDFLNVAEPLVAQIGAHPVEMNPRQFATGSVGYNACFKTDLLIGGKVVKCQVGVNVTVVGSKEQTDKSAVA